MKAALLGLMLALVLALVLTVMGCGDDDAPPGDAGALLDGTPVDDGGSAEMSADSLGQDTASPSDAPGQDTVQTGDGFVEESAPPADGPAADTIATDTAPSPDAIPDDTAIADAAIADAVIADAAIADAAIADAAIPDAPVADAPIPDAPIPDAPIPDAPIPDAPAGSAQIVITEMMINPAARNDNDAEWFEIYNAGSSQVNLNGWRIEDLGSDSHTISGDVLIDPGQYIVLGRSNVLTPGDPDYNGGVVVAYEYSGFSLSNPSNQDQPDDEIYLYDDLDTLIDSVEYDTESGWTIPNGASISLVAVGADNNDPVNWCVETTPWATSAGDSGTPGEPAGCPVSVDAGPTPDTTVDLATPDTTVDLPLPDTTVDLPLPDTTVDLPLLDTTVDLPPSDSTVDLPPPGCGNGVREGTEQCDDGNTTNLDGCDANCLFEQCHRINYILMERGTDSFCGGNALTDALLVDDALDAFQEVFDDGIADGSISILFKMLDLDDLTGTNDPSVIVGVMSGTPVADPAYDGTADLDWWYDVSPGSIDGQRDPLDQMNGSIVSSVLTAGPGRVTLPLDLDGNPGLLTMADTMITVDIGSSSTPLSSSGGTPGHLTTENLDPALQSYETGGTQDSDGAGKLCGKTIAESMQQIPLPEALIDTCEELDDQNTLLDAYVVGCTTTFLWFTIDVIEPTQPDTDDSTVDPAGAGPPYTFTTNGQNQVTGCEDSNGDSVNLNDCLQDAAYSTFIRFATGRVIIH